MKIRVFLLALALLPACPAGAQVVSIKSLFMNPSDGEDGQGWETMVTLAVPEEPGCRLISFNGKRSSVLEATDSVTGQPVKVIARFIDQATIAGSRRETAANVSLSITAPAQNARAWIKLKGTLVFKNAVETKNHKVLIKLTDGYTFKAGDFPLAVKDTRTGGDKTNFKLHREDGSFESIYEIRFTDGEGNPVRVDRRGGSSSMRNQKIIDESRIFGCPSECSELNAEFEIVERTETKEVPFDIVVPVNP